MGFRIGKDPTACHAGSFVIRTQGVDPVGVLKNPAQTLTSLPLSLAHRIVVRPAASVRPSEWGRSREGMIPAGAAAQVSDSRFLVPTHTPAGAIRKERSNT